MSFFVQAHQDDWQVHMGSTAGGLGAYSDLCSGGKVTLVFTTAGDAGRPAGWWNAREEGTKASVAHVVRGVLNQSTSWQNGVRTYNGHDIPISTIGPVVCIFMRRLPDGGDGGGFGPRFQSLKKLHDSNQAVTSVDGRADTYGTWDDFVLTLGAILAAESGNDANEVWINAIGEI
jgi:hypothetical protein